MRSTAFVNVPKDLSKAKSSAKTPRSLEITAFLAPTGGFEPLACRLGGGRSIRLSYVGKALKSISAKGLFVN